MEAIITKEIIFYVYRKWKNIVYYSNDLLYKKKIVDFEHDNNIYEVFSSISEFLNNPNSEKSKLYLEGLASKINYFFKPKKVFFEDKNKVICGNEDKQGYLESVNMFFDGPIELFIIDLFIALNLGKELYDKNYLNDNISFANKFKNSVFDNGKINYKDRDTFEIYFYQYQKWRDTAYDKAKRIIDSGKNAIIINYDIKSFYYNVNLNFSEIREKITNHNNLKYLEILELIYKKYTKKTHRVKTGIYSHGSNECLLPIGLESSKVISNVYMFDYDKYINKSVSNNYCIEYYGRYVDDYLIVLSTNKEINQKENPLLLINEELQLFNVIRDENNDERISLKGYSTLEIQEGKTDVYYFRANEQSNLLHVYEHKLRTQASNVTDFFDDDFADKNYIDQIYKNDRSEFFTKFSDIKTSKIDKLALSRYLTKIFNLYKFSNVKKSEVKEIEKIFNMELSYLNLIDNFSLVEKIYKVLAILNEKNINKYNDIQKEFVNNELDLSKIQGIKVTKRNLNKIRRDIQLSMDIALLLVLCVNPTIANKKIEALIKYRNSLMFDKKLVCIPLTQFYKLNNSTNLMDSKLLENIFDVDYDKQKVKVCPYVILFSEYELYMNLFSLYRGSDINYGEIFKNYWGFIEKDYDNQYLWEKNQQYQETCLKQKINIHQRDENNALIEYIEVINQPSLNLPKYVDESNEKEFEKYDQKLFEKFPLGETSISIVSLPLKEKEIFSKVALRESYKVSEYKRKIYSVLNESKKHSNVKFIVFPELSIPIEWINDLCFYCRKFNKTIIFGMFYIYQNKCKKTFAKNVAGVINYFKDKGTYNHARVFLREKNFYPYFEKLKLEKEYRVIVQDNKRPSYYIINFRGVNYSFMVCYELTDIVSRASLKGKIDILFVPVFNKDTNYFSNLVSSSSRDLYSYVAMSNTSVYGDSRITAPYDSVHKDIVQIKGGDNAFCAIGKVEISNLQKQKENSDKFNRKRYMIENKKKNNDKDKFKPLSAGTKK